MAKSLEEIEAAFRAQYQFKQSNMDAMEETEDVEGPAVPVQIEEKQEPPASNQQANVPVVKNEREAPEQEDIQPETAEGADHTRATRASIISDIIFYFALIAMVVCAVLFSRGALGAQAFGGYRFYEVLTTSMESVYPRGSLLLIKEIETSELAVGDDISFARDSSNIITHRIEEIYEDYEGRGSRAFVTKGVDNATADADVVLSENVIGKVTKGIPGLGASLSWLGGNLWLILLLFLSLVACSFFIKIYFRESRQASKEKQSREKQSREKQGKEPGLKERLEKARAGVRRRRAKKAKPIAEKGSVSITDGSE